MKIEITVEGQEPIIHKLTKPKTLLGAGQDCDVVLEADGISRKHLLIVAEDDQYFVVDQGSTNGSFINEERLVPGQRASFTSFFPLKLGFHVTLALLSDEDSSEKFDFAKGLASTAEPTGIKSKTASAAATAVPRTPGKVTASSVPSRTSAPAVKPKNLRGGKEDGSSMAIKVMAFVIAVGGSAAFFMTREKEVEVVQTPQETIVEEVKPPDLKEVQWMPVVPTGATSAGNAVSDQKCALAEDKEFCSQLVLPHAQYGQTGVVSGATSLVWVLPLLSGPELVEEFTASFQWADMLKGRIPKQLDPRDVIALYLLRTDEKVWEALSDDKRWLYVVMLNAAGTREEVVWLTDIKNLKALIKNKNEWQSLSRQATQSYRVDALGGMFRMAPLGSN